MRFEDLNVHPDLKSALADQGLETLTQIQEDTIEPARQGRDIVGISQTGTGKTIAFLLPVVDNIIKAREEGKQPAALILTPTREICLQIAEEVEKLLTHHDMNIATIFGGDSYDRQEKQLAAGPSVIVATPGRLIDYIKQNKFPTDSVHHLILDEADRMFDMGFIRDIRFIMKKLPEKSQTMLFSATMSYYVMRLAWDFMHDPVEVRTKAETIEVDKIDQHLFHLGREEKMPYLVNLILGAEEPRAIIFTNYKRRVLDITKKLHRYGIAATGLSSLLDQKKRVRLLKQFKLGKYSVLVATDVASRGLDVDDITHVFNYDLPQDSESYVHRIGRTARAGKTGISYSFCSEEDYECLPRIEQLLRHKIPVSPVDPAFVAFPQGSYSPFRDAAENHLEESGSSQKGRSRRRPPRSGDSGGSGRDRSAAPAGGDRPPRRDDGEEARQGSEGSRRRRRKGPSQKSDQRPPARTSRSADADGATVRDQDRARLLGRDGAPATQGGSTGSKPKRSNQRKKQGSGEGRRDQNQSRNNRGERRDRRDRRDQRDQRDQRQKREPAAGATEKKGILQKIFGVFKKKKD
ncbi:MAG: DEAD/DEAH box helicase [Leptospiraceae bacterium]|nr:DEAD/DEAH box helicase [Leptospiraceae bacterium]